MQAGTNYVFSQSINQVYTYFHLMLMLQIYLTQGCQVKLSSKSSFKEMYKQASQRRCLMKKFYLLLFKDCAHLVFETLKFN